MNFFAHLHLSPDFTEVRVFNFTGDGFKGQGWRKEASLAARIGVDLHRFIDHYADQHPKTRELKLQLRPSTGRYSGVALDLLGDYFLHKHFAEMNQFHPSIKQTSSRQFAIQCTHEISNHQPILKGRAAQMAPHLIQQNWLLSYAQWPGLNAAAKGIAKRHEGAQQLASFFYAPPARLIEAAEVWFLEFYPELVQAASEFWSDHPDWVQLQSS
jgi:acyl carrier protein phosphodiesterase